jgi:hypothetical protein
VSDKVVAELAVGQVPDLHKSVPSTRNNEGNRLGRREADARNPFSVAFRISTDSVLALSKGIPKADGGITRSCSDNGKQFVSTAMRITVSAKKKHLL